MSARERAFMIFAVIVLPVFVYGMIVSAMFGSVIPYPTGKLAIVSLIFLPFYGALVARVVWAMAQD